MPENSGGFGGEDGYIASRGQGRASRKSNDDGVTYFKSVVKQLKKGNDEMLAETDHFLEARNAAYEHFDVTMMQKRLETEKLNAADRLELEKNLAAAIQSANETAYRATEKYIENLKKSGNAKDRREHNKRTQEVLADKKKESAKMYEIEMQAAKDMGKEGKRERAKLRANRAKEILEESEEESRLEAEARQLDETESLKSLGRVNDGIKKLVSKDFKGGISSVMAEAGKINLSEVTKNFHDNVASMKNELNDKEGTLVKLNELGDSKEVREKRLKLEEEIGEKKKEIEKEAAKEFASAAAEAIVSKIGADYKAAFGEAERFLTSSAAHMNARLQGTWENFNSITDLVTSNLSISPYVQTQRVLDQIKEASDQGIAYNLEQRAFLSEISDKIANTFDAFDSNLTRLIRLQQADSTAARLGMEATLTKLFNSMFEDTSYLGGPGGGGLADQVAAAILDAESQLGRNAAAEFEYTVQKWLGSLSSLGMSETAITNIAQGLNYLATGDVTSLSSNSSLQTLFAMSANRANLSYANILTGGLNASNTNKLLEAMVEYLKEIAENADNQVVKGAYGNIFNLSLSDLKAISNITQSEISTIAGNNPSYTSMNLELMNQFAQLPMRMSMPEMLGNIYNNAMYGLASDMANNPVTYAMTKMLNFAETLGTDINIPFVSAAGFGLDLNTTVLGLVKTASNIMTIMGLAGTILNGLRGITAMGGLNLAAWGATETTQRGGIGNLLSTIVGGVSGSQTTYRTNYNKEDTTNQSLAQATEDSKSTKKITNKGFEDEEDDAKSANKATVASSSIKGKGDNWFWVRDVLLNAVYDTVENGSLRVIDRPMGNYLTSILGTQPIVESGVVKTMIAGSSSLEVIVKDYRGGTIPVRVTNSSEMAPKSSVSISGNVNIDKNMLKAAIAEALGFKDESGIPVTEHTMAQLVDKIAEDNIRIRAADSYGIPVVINGVGSSLPGHKIPVTTN